MDAEQETKVKKPKWGCSHCNKVFLCKACHTNGHVQPVIKMITGNQFDYGYAINHPNLPLVVLNFIKGRQSFRERGALEKNLVIKMITRNHFDYGIGCT